MDKMKMHSPDLTAENIEKLAGLFPQCLVECKDADGKIVRKIDFEALQRELSRSIIDGSQERYVLNWPGKREAVLLANSPVAKTLRPCREESVDFNHTQNLYIEGDNLDVLKLLRDTYLGKVKMIYIDPPYNTGNDFVYKDDFSEDIESYLVKSNQTDDQGMRLIANPESRGRYHSDWLTMIYPRLRLAHQLLRDDGVIFISIDDNEVHNLRKVCDEIFGEDNFVASIIWQKKYSPQNDAKWFSESHDYILCLGKVKEFWTPCGLSRSDTMNARYSNPDSDPRGKWKPSDMLRKDEQKTGLYEIVTPSGRVCYPRSGTSWRIPEYRYKEFVNDNRIWFGMDGNNIPAIKRFLSEVKKDVTPQTIWLHNEVGHNQQATQEVRSIFDEKAFFDTPKPVSLIERIIQISGLDSDDIVLDFFSGSATSAHAVMKLNAEDGGTRKFIMVQLPEACAPDSEAFKAGYKNICEIGKERIRRAGAKILEEWKTQQDKKENDLFTEGGEKSQLDIGFRVLKLDSSNMEDVYYTADAIDQDMLVGLVDNVKTDRTAEDLLFQVMLDWGVALSVQVTAEKLHGKTVYFVDTDAIAACFESGVTDELIKAVADRKVLRAVFRDSSFANDAAKINVVEIFKQLSPSTEVKVI